MTNADYARIHYVVAIKLWQESGRWLSLFPEYGDYTALRVDAMSIALDLATAEASRGRIRRGVAW